MELSFPVPQEGSAWLLRSFRAPVPFGRMMTNQMLPGCAPMGSLHFLLRSSSPTTFFKKSSMFFPPPCLSGAKWLVTMDPGARDAAIRS